MGRITMPTFEWLATEGKQRVVWAQPNGQPVGQIVSAESEQLALKPSQFVVIESGVAVIDGGFQLNNVLSRRQIRIPIVDLDEGVEVVKVVAATWPSSYSSSDDADHFGWAVDRTKTILETGENKLFLIIDRAMKGAGTIILRFA